MLINDNFLRLLVWTVTDGSFDGSLVRFKISKDRKIKRLTELLNSLCFNYSHVVCSKLEKIQTKLPHRITLKTIDSKNIFEYLYGVKELPNWFLTLNKEQAKIVFNEYSVTDGCWCAGNPNSLEISSSNYQDIIILKELNNIHFKCNIWEYTRKRNANNNFKETKPNTMLRIHRLKKEITNG